MPDAGWHADPIGKHEKRYWDGSQWTEHVTDAGAPSMDPLIVPGPVDQHPEGSPGEATASHESTTPRAAVPSDADTHEVGTANGVARRWKWAVVAGAVVAVIVIVAVIMGGSGGDNNGSATDSKVVRPTDGGSSTTAATTTPVSKPSVEIVSYGFTQLPPDSIGNSYVTYAVVLKNNSTSQTEQSISVNVAFYDAAGTVVKAQDDNVNFLLPGQTAATAESGISAAGAVKMTVQALPGQTYEVKQTVGTFTAEGINTTRQQFGGAKTNCLLKSTFAKDLKQLYATAVYYDASNQIIGGGFTFVDFVPAAGQAAVEISGPQLPADPARTEVYANLSNLTAASL